MGLYRVTEAESQAVLGCGHDVTFALADLKVLRDVVIFSPCPTCGAVLSVKCVPVQDKDDAGRRERCIAIHTLHKRVHALGLYAKDANPDEVLASMHALAKEDSVVEAPSAHLAIK